MLISPVLKPVRAVTAEPMIDARLSSRAGNSSLSPSITSCFMSLTAIVVTSLGKNSKERADDDNTIEMIDRSVRVQHIATDWPSLLVQIKLNRYKE